MSGDMTVRKRYNLRPRGENIRNDARRAFIEEKLARILDSSSEDEDFETSVPKAPVSESPSHSEPFQDQMEDSYQEELSISDEDSSSSEPVKSRRARYESFCERSSASPEPERRRKSKVSTIPPRKRGRDGDNEIIDQILKAANEIDEDGNLANLVVPDELVDDIFDQLKSQHEEDWVLDTALLGTVIEKKIVSKFPVLTEDSKKLHTVILEALAEADEGIVEQYAGGKPNDKIWKLGMNEEKIAELEPLLKEARTTIEEEEPTMARILETEMSAIDRKKLIQLFDIYKNMDPYTTDELEMRERINSNLKNVSKDVTARREADNEEHRIMSTAASLTSESLKTRIIGLQTGDVKKRRMLELLAELEETCKSSSMYRATKEKLEWLISLPYEAICPLEVEFGKSTAAEINAFCSKVRNLLDTDPKIGLYGMKEAKDEIIAGLNNRITNPRSNVMICLHGSPGTGKSFLAASVAAAVGLPFERISLGGVNDSTFLLGSDSHYLGSTPGIILRALRNMKVSNGVVLFDEIDKLGTDERGLAVQNALLHITDYTTNKDFRDKYLTDYGHDISNIWFMASVNDLTRLSPPLRDRMNVIDVDKYNAHELKHIIKEFTLPRILEDLRIPKDQVTIDDSGASAILTLLGNHIELEGVRPIQKLVRMIASRINLLRTTILEDGSTGSLNISYKIPGFKLPIVVDSNVVRHLIDKTKLSRVSSKLQMYI